MACVRYIIIGQHLLGNEGYRNNLMILLCHFLKVGLLLYVHDFCPPTLFSLYPQFLFVVLFTFISIEDNFLKEYFTKKVILKANPTQHGFVQYGTQQYNLIEGSFASADFEWYIVLTSRFIL